MYMWVYGDRRRARAVPGPDADREPGRHASPSRSRASSRWPTSMVFPGQSDGERRDRRTAQGCSRREVPAARRAAPGPVTYTLRRAHAGHVPLPQRHAARPAGRDGARRRDHRAARRVRHRLHDVDGAMPQGLRRRLDRVRSRVPLLPHRRRSADPPAGRVRSAAPEIAAGCPAWTLTKRHAGRLVHQRPQLPRHDHRLGRAVAPDAAVQRLPRLHPGEKVLMRMVGGGRRPASVPHARAEPPGHRARRAACSAPTCSAPPTPSPTWRSPTTRPPPCRARPSTPSGARGPAPARLGRLRHRRHQPAQLQRRTRQRLRSDRRTSTAPITTSRSR